MRNSGNKSQAPMITSGGSAVITPAVMLGYFIMFCILSLALVLCI